MAVIVVFKEKGIGKKGPPVYGATFTQTGLGKGEADIALNAVANASIRNQYTVQLAKGLLGTIRICDPADGDCGTIKVQNIDEIEVLI